MMGSPIVKFLSTDQGRLNSFAIMNLKILFTFILCLALEKKRVAFIAFAYALACTKSNQTKLSIFKPQNVYPTNTFFFLSYDYLKPTDLIIYIFNLNLTFRLRYMFYQIIKKYVLYFLKRKVSPNIGKLSGPPLLIFKRGKSEKRKCHKCQLSQN